MFLASEFTIMWPRISKIDTQDALINSNPKSKFQLSRFYCFLVIKQINLQMPKFANKNNGTTSSREAQISKNIASIVVAHKSVGNEICK